MAPHIAFVTGNDGKFATARDHLSVFGVVLTQVRLDLDEIQSPSVRDVALHKARQAYGVLRQPLIVEDSGFGIDELRGYPGPMIKYLLVAAGAEGVAHLAGLTANRSGRFTSTLVYVDDLGALREFTEVGEPGRIAEHPMGDTAEHAWSVLWNVFIAAGTSVPLAALSAETRQEVFARWRASSVFARFGQWLLKQTPGLSTSS